MSKAIFKHVSSLHIKITMWHMTLIQFSYFLEVLITKISTEYRDHNCQFTEKRWNCILWE